MASKVFVPKPSANHIVVSGENKPSRSHSFGQVCLPKKRSEKIYSSSSSLLSSSSSTHVASANTIPSAANTIPSAAISTAKFAKSVSTNTTSSTLAELWREIQGCNNWENLVKPLHPLLRQETIRYGEFVAACYKAFDLDPNSKRYLCCKYGKSNMFNQIGMGNCGYQVTKYIYATPDVNIPIQHGASCGRWIGYVAVSSDDTVNRLGRRDIVITFRGTVTKHEWFANFMSSLTPARLDPHNPRPNVKVESGFLSLYTSDESDNKFGLESCREQLLSEVSRLLNKYKGEEISISMAGHSMGSSLALLLAYDISELGLNRLNNPTMDIRVTVFSFGGPRVGNTGFKERCEELGVKVLRIVNVNDPITKLPGVFLNENFRVLGGRYEFPWSCSLYSHVGVELVLDFFNMQNPSCVHDLEAYISSLLAKCSKRSSSEEDDHHHHDVYFLNKAKGLLLSAKKLNLLPMKIAVSNIINLVQSQKAEFLINEQILGWMNTLTLYMLF